MYISYAITLSYFFSLIFFISGLLRQNERYSKIGLYIGVFGFILHTYYLYKITFGEIIQVDGLEKSLVIFAWFIPLVFLISNLIYKLPFIGAFIFSLAFIGMVPSLIVPHGMIQTEDPTINNPWILTHVILIFLALAIFAIAFVAGVFYLFEERKIKGKQFGSMLQQLPSLNTLDKINHIGLTLGFPLITIGMAVGFFIANQILGPDWKWSDKETWSVVTWIVYATLLNCRLSLGWKGKKAAMGAVIGFGIIVITLINTV